MIGKQVTIVCDGGWKYTGKVEEINISLFGKLQHLKLKVAKGIIFLNSSKVVSIMVYEKN